jgi:hypothetical protein
VGMDSGQLVHRPCDAKDYRGADRLNLPNLKARNGVMSWLNLDRLK